ncbi:T9SS type A sorting domain-containing protein [Mucilaginibacter limnophilus]|uniref:T9SS type A sorting domain-containing protein n=1 Tax=Mucilaginibacter limnophilus TaxID=1932778 RepID=A0A437MFZ6_9SPHI|nr:T9SS type A sorting domain-containing protein [Mucilaginibacter limnophilus]RVT96532.1 T9SS type A sorting domain-containing protein [Mucilaginibacter limnophilus]
MKKCFRLLSVKIILVALATIVFLNNAYAQDQRIPFISVVSSQNTGQDYSPWLNDNLDSLVQEAWQDNFVYVDVTLRLKYHSRITQIKLYDYTGVFEDKPAEIYSLNGTQRTLLGTFTGPGYMTFQYINLPSPIEADAIIVHKYSNNIPQKVFAYGISDTTRINTPDTATNQPPVTNPPPVNPQPEPTDGLTKIPIDAKRWYQLNNVSDGLSGLFDGITDTEVNTGYGKIFNNYEAYYPVEQGERINLKKIRFYNNTGGLGDFPVTVSVIDSTGNRRVVGVYKGGYYKKWLGPNPAQPEKYLLDTAVSNVRYIILNCWYQFPTEIEFYGDYLKANAQTESQSPVITRKRFPISNYIGINAFEWDFEDGNNPDQVESTRMTAMRNFSQVRHYMDWEKLESTPGGYTFSPTHSGGWNYDAMYKAMRESDMEILADLKTLPNWMLETYPADQRDTENIPVKYGSDYSDPKSYIEQAKVAFQFTARYGSNKNVNPALLSVNSTPRWTADPINTVKIGLKYVKYIECDNERDKWWKGRKGYQTAYEYAANLSAFYDGHKNTMGPGVGVKNADPNMKVVMGGLASANTEYLKGMVEWCRMNRGYKPDGTVNLCWDYINYHWYSHDAQMVPNSFPTRGVAPEKNNTYQKAIEFIEAANKYCNGMPVWVTEAGYDANENSPIRAIPIGKKTISETQADWILRTILLYSRAGIGRLFIYQAYDDNFYNPTQYASSGMLKQNRMRKPAADFMVQVNKLIGDYAYAETLNADPIVDRYELDGKSAYALMVPDEIGRTAQYTLSVPNADSVTVYTPTIGKSKMPFTRMALKNGKITLTVTETPIFVLPVERVLVGALMSTHSTLMALKKPLSETPKVSTLSVYPNPAVNQVNVAFSNTNYQQVNITLTDAATGRTYGNYTFAKAEDDFSQTIDVTQLPAGINLVIIKQGDETKVEKLIKSR